MMDFVSVLSAFGVGAVVSAVIQSFLSQRGEAKSRSFDERKSAYIGLFKALQRVHVEGSDVSEDFALWKIRCELVAPKPVRDAIQTLIDTDEYTEARIKALEDLQNAMRRDLGISV